MTINRASSIGRVVRIAVSGTLLLSTFVSSILFEPASAIGVLSSPSAARIPVSARQRALTRPLNLKRTTLIRRTGESKWAKLRREQADKNDKLSTKPQPKKPAVASRPLQPQSFSDKMSSTELAPGVVHRFYRGSLAINLLDIDMNSAPIKVRPYLAGNSFNSLKDVAQHAKEANALAAVNANYFKRNGVPLGTVIINGEWVAGPLYDRVSMGFTKSGAVRIDRISFGGKLTSDNPDLPQTWVNNLNQPRRSGCHVFAYTRRWGDRVKLPYDGSIVAIDAQGRVMDSVTAKEMEIPWGGIVLTDSKDAEISLLKRGDTVKIDWQTAADWSDVTDAVSGGPMLIKDGKLFIDLKGEKFKGGWTGSQIRARTVAGVTADKHLLLATVEGPHTLWDIAKFLRKLGAVDAMNLDGGGSTTMVVNGKTVTRNANSSQRRVASSIVLLDTRKMPYLTESRTIGAPIDAVVANPAPDLLGTPGASNDSGVNVGAITAPPAQLVDVDSANAEQDDANKHRKKKHFFGLFGKN